MQIHLFFTNISSVTHLFLIEKFNKMKNCRDIREEYVEYFEEKRLKKRFRSNRKIRKKF